MRLPQIISKRIPASALLRLTLWHVLVLTLFIVTLGCTIYILISRTFYASSDGVLSSITGATVAIMRHDLSESGIEELAARDAIRMLNFPGYTLSIYDSYDNVLAEKPVGNGNENSMPLGRPLNDGKIHLYTVEPLGRARSLRRVAAIHVTLQPGDREYTVVASQPFDSVLSQLQRRRLILSVTLLFSVMAAGLASWFLIRRSLAPVLEMSKQALYISATNLEQRFYVGESRDELNKLASTFNDLLSRLSASFQLQRHFMADASHELRTPLSIICSTASVSLELSEFINDDCRNSLRLIQQEGRRLTRIVEDMFCLAGADSGGVLVDKSVFDLDEMLLDALHAINWLASARKIKIQIESLEESPAYGDQYLLRRIFINLLANAVKHTPPEGYIFVRLERSQGSYRVSIRDTGPGIAAEHHQLIFERFYRVRASKLKNEDISDMSSGAGLGLPIARMLAQAHGGNVLLECSDGQGSTFVCDLPIFSDVSAHAAADQLA